MPRRSRRLRNCKIVSIISQNEATQEQSLEQEQQSSQGQQSTSSQMHIGNEDPSNNEQQSDVQEGRDVWIVGNNGQRRRKRGRTTMADIWNLAEEERIKIEVDKYGCPCTEEGAVLSSFLGVIAKNGRYAPLDIHRWDNKALNSYKEKMLKLIEEKEFGKEPDRLTFWEITHKKKTGEFVDSDTERKINAARKDLDGVVTQGIEPTSELIEELFTKHIGPEHNGRVKGLGLGPTPTSYYRLNCWPSNNQASSSDERSREVDQLKGEMKGLRQEVERLQALMSKKFPEENLGSPSPTSAPPIIPQVVDHGSANCSSPNIRSSNSSHEPQTILHGRTI